MLAVSRLTLCVVAQSSAVPKEGDVAYTAHTAEITTTVSRPLAFALRVCLTGWVSQVTEAYVNDLMKLENLSREVSSPSDPIWQP
jgi:hypothetical protein